MKYLSILLVIFFLGCSEKIVYVDRNHYKSIPKPLITDDIELPEDINVTIYIKATPPEREDMLYNLIMELSTDVYLYKVKIKNIKKYDNNASSMYR